MLYEFLLGEIALQRGDLPLAAQTFLDLARRTSDPRVARRAVEVANQARLPELALDAARTWQELDPGSPQALQVLAVLLVANKRAEEALPHLEKLLATEGVSPENGFMQLNRLLAASPDKAANLRVVRTLASKYPKLPQAHFAVAQAAAAAGDDDAAIAAAHRACAPRRPGTGSGRKRTSRGRRPPPPPATTTPRLRRSTAQARCGPIGSSRRSWRRRSCSAARPPRPPRSSAISSPRIRIRARRGSTTPGS